MSNSEFTLYGDITEESAGRLVHAIQSSDAQKSILHLSSAGGSTFGGLSIVGAIAYEQQKYSVEFICRITGVCMSAAVAVAAQCNIVECNRDAQFMVHQSRIKLNSNMSTAEIRSEANYLSGLDQAFTDIILRRAKNGLGRMMQAKTEGGHDWNFDAETAKHYGIVDNIWGFTPKQSEQK